VSDIEEKLAIDPSELELLLDPRRRDEPRAPIDLMLTDNPVVSRIRSIATPMFLGLERRRYQGNRVSNLRMMDITRQREMRRRHLREDEDELSVGAVGAGLMEVLWLIRDTMSEVRAHQERLDAELREKLLLSAVRFKPSDFESFEPPSPTALRRYRERQAELEQAAGLLKLPLDEVRASLQQFFDQMSQLSGSIEGETQGRKKKSQARTKKQNELQSKALMTWLLNKSQVDRILENLGEFESYAKAREALHEPINRFLDLLNKFLAQTRKAVELAARDRLRVRLPGDRVRTVKALSSGERQLLVMLGHLALNEHLRGSAVFIVDEPELSLHLSWQEMFVDSVQEANPEVQLIFATHSPAIILDKVAHCCTLGGVA